MQHSSVCSALMDDWNTYWVGLRYSTLLLLQSGYKVLHWWVFVGFDFFVLFCFVFLFWLGFCWIVLWGFLGGFLVLFLGWGFFWFFWGGLCWVFFVSFVFVRCWEVQCYTFKWYLILKINKQAHNCSLQGFLLCCILCFVLQIARNAYILSWAVLNHWCLIIRTSCNLTPFGEWSVLANVFKENNMLK